MRIPNIILDEFKNATELKVACIFYSLISRRTKTNLMGYEITVKQDTLCKYSCLSLPTVKKALAALADKGFILSQKRSTYDMRQGTYIYSIKKYDLSDNYFLSDRPLFRRLNGQVFRVYMHFCRFAAGADRSFYHSYTDLSKKLGIDRREVVKAVNKLGELGLIFVRRKLTHEGDYTDNSYIVYRYRRGRIRKQNKVKRLITSGNVVSPKKNSFINVYIAYILTHKNGFVKGLKCGIEDFLCIKGGSG